ncbi:hypothetical protein [Nocardioides stalactiti]|uniref:hypothetical protein n=1 Tax=Nocardioides stalactiti TaxID=2755356 RepID=UPI0016018581|nr:hypothetical protein [Nocardioides stalactiti]
MSFEAHGETRQRISWDFTLPQELAIEASKDRVAVPLATLRKEPLKRLDVTDAAGTAIPIWGTDDNGALATEALVSGLSGVLGRELSTRELEALRSIVFATQPEQYQPALKLIRDALGVADRTVEGTPLMAVAEDLAVNFILVVELPAETAGTRTLVKMQYEGDVNGDGEPTAAYSVVHNAWFDGAAWSSTRSWHVEVHAPPGLAIHALTASRWDADDDDIKPLGVSPVLGHTAHVAGQTTPLGSLSWFELELRPARSGLVSQTLFGALMTGLLLVAGVIFDDALYDAVKDPNRASAVVAIMLAVPAFLLALLSRGQEHGLVSRLLLLPRMINLAVAVVLLFTAAALVLGTDKDYLSCTLRALLAVQFVLFVAAGVVWGRSVGGDP